MRRRDFIKVIAGSAAAWPLAARAQHANKLPIIGFLGASTASANGPWVTAFVQRLHDLGWIAERTVAIEYRWAELHDEGAAASAAEFVQLKVDVIVTTGFLAAVAARQATTSIPIVFTAVGDPIATGLVASLAQPGGNATGLSMQQTDTASKRLELLREVVPSVRHLAIMANTRNPSAALRCGRPVRPPA
jgi:putative tryptophan/tyrosine transport system substrate-binding protein